MHTFKLTRPFALVLAIVCLAIAVPTSDVHAVGNVPDSAVVKDRIVTHSRAATSPTDKTGGLTQKPDSECDLICRSDSDCCFGFHCDISDPDISPKVSAPLLIAENGKTY